MVIFGIICNIVSEYDQNNKDLKVIYIISHMLWHLIVFDLMDYFYVALFVKRKLRSKFS